MLSVSGLELESMGLLLPWKQEVVADLGSAVELAE